MAVCVLEDHATPGGGQSFTKDLKMTDITVEELAVTRQQWREELSALLT